MLALVWLQHAAVKPQTRQVCERKSLRPRTKEAGRNKNDATTVPLGMPIPVIPVKIHTTVGAES